MVGTAKCFAAWTNHACVTLRTFTLSVFYSFCLLRLTVLAAQHIFIVGGQDAHNYMLDSAAVYDPASDSHTDLTSMSTARMGFDMGRLGDLVCACLLYTSPSPRDRG